MREQATDERLVGGRDGHLREGLLGPLPGGEGGPLVRGGRRRLTLGRCRGWSDAAARSGQGEIERPAVLPATRRRAKEVRSDRRPGTGRPSLGAGRSGFIVRPLSALRHRGVPASLSSFPVRPFRALRRTGRLGDPVLRSGTAGGDPLPSGIARAPGGGVTVSWRASAPRLGRRGSASRGFPGRSPHLLPYPF